MAQSTTTTSGKPLFLMAEGYPEDLVDYHLVRSPSQFIDYIKYVGIPTHLVVRSLSGMKAQDALGIFIELTLTTKLPSNFAIIPCNTLDDSEYYTIREMASRYFDRKNKYI